MKTEIKSTRSRKYFEAMETLKTFHGTTDLAKLEGKSGCDCDRKHAVRYTVEDGKLYMEDLPNIRW